jgi:hypothetical protein
MKLHSTWMALATCAALSACGSGGSQNDDVTPPVVVNEVPASAIVSATAYTNYAKSLKNSDSDEAVGVNNVTMAPTSETEAPLMM